MNMMTLMALKQEIIDYSKEIGIDKIGFASAGMFSELKDRLVRQQELGYQSGFEEPDIEKRTTPTKLLPEAKSIISIAIAYPSKMENPPRSTKEDRRGTFSKSSWGVDYHVALRERLQKLEAFILEKEPDALLKSMTDTGELSDRAAAQRAGIGWSGKNCSIITPEFGSYVYLGEMITNIPFVPDTPIEDQCGSCNKCIEACPTGALIQGGQINAQRCLSFVTQTKSFLTEEFRVKLGNRLYGCDTCQVVCPHNKGIDFHFHPEFEPEPELVKPKLKPILSIGNREFKESFGTLSGSWRGKKPIQRNAIIALSHFKDETAIPDLLKLLKEDSRPVIRGTAAWALGRIGKKEVIEELEQFQLCEKDEQVLEELSSAIEVLKN